MRKGITPVIAVVLLLLITVGAVASAWGLYQQITSDQGQLDQLNQRQQAQNTNLEFASVYNSTSGSINMTIKNTGSRAVNLSDELSFYVVPPGSDGQMAYSTFVSRFPGWDEPGSPNTCFDSSAGILDTGSTYTCDTGISFPGATDSIGLVIDYNAVSDVSWDYTCNPQTSSTVTC